MTNWKKTVLASWRFWNLDFCGVKGQNIAAISNIVQVGLPSWGVTLITPHCMRYYTDIFMGQIMLLVLFYSQTQQTNGIEKNNLITCCFH